MSSSNRILFVLLLFCTPALAQTQYFLTTQTPTESGAYSPCATSQRAVHAQRGAGVTTSVTNSVSSGTDLPTTVDATNDVELCFPSDPVLTTTNVNGTVTFNIWGFESAAQCNCAFRVKVYDYNGSTETLIVDSSMSSELTTSNAVNSWTATITNYSLAAGHRVIIRTRITNIGTMGNNRMVTMNYAGTTSGASGDSFVTLPTTVPLTRTRTVKSSGGDYASLSAWETGERGNLTTLAEIRQAEIYALHDTTAVSMAAANWVTSSTYYVRLFTVAPYTGGNTIDTSKYYLDVSNNTALTISTDFAKVEGLQIQQTYTGSGHHGIVFSGQNTGGVINLSKTIIKGVFSGAAASDFGIVANTLTGTSATLNMWNNVIYGFTNSAGSFAGLLANTAGWTVNAYNNTAYNCAVGFDRVNGTVISINNAAQSTRDSGFLGTFDATSDFNASDHADAPGANSQQSATAVFVDAANGNFRPASTDAALMHNGTDDPGSGLFSDDIRGVTRTSPWDIGAYITMTPVTCPASSLTLLGVGCGR